MKLADAVTNAYKTRWSFVNTFRVNLNFSDAMKKKIEWTSEDDKDFDLHVIGVDLPTISYSPIETYMANRWRIGQGKFEIFRSTITFRESNQLRYYRKLCSYIIKQRNEYYDSVCFDVIFHKLPDHLNEAELQIGIMEKCIIENISQIQFSNNTENQIAEFSITVKSPVYTITAKKTTEKTK